jgi:hypothetical protein
MKNAKEDPADKGGHLERSVPVPGPTPAAVAREALLSPLVGCVCLILASNGALAGEAQQGQAARTRETNPPVRTDRFGDPLPEGAVFRLGTLRLRYARPLIQIAFSRDGKRVASWSWGLSARSSFWVGDQVRLWDLATGRQVRAFPAFFHPCFAFSPDGKTLAINGNGGVCFYDPATGKNLHRACEGPNFDPLCFSADGRTLYALGCLVIQSDAGGGSCPGPATQAGAGQIVTAASCHCCELSSLTRLRGF